MFIGHYGPAYAIKAIRPAMPLWLLFIAVQLVDVAWAVLVLLGIEKVRIVPGITASNPLDLYYMPYTHSLVGAVLWSLAAIVLCKPAPGVRKWRTAAWIGLAVFSHWVLDWLVHRPDLPLYGDTLKVGLGLWNHPAIALLLEAALLFGGMAMYLRRTTAINAIGRLGPPVLGILMLAIQCYVFFGPPPSSPTAAAITALISYVVFAAVAEWLDRQRQHAPV
ncbi:hypothetical protein [Rhodoferax ferrireducens]|uniref:hypothetical protein n=1 Tax=Rhodoferax ferrireducens TaxID=192843 RepID=UPI000E0D5A65|nr:hypothetical protein [Rhodoferax ferrireducens]